MVATHFERPYFPHMAESKTKPQILINVLCILCIYEFSIVCQQKRFEFITLIRYLFLGNGVYFI